MPATEPPVAAVVLAAGASTRLGRNKLLLDLGGESVVRRAVRTAIEARLDPVIVVLGHEAERVREELVGLRCEVIVNPDHARGAGTSLRAGVARVAATGAEALVLMLADMPLVTAEMLATLVLRRRETRAPLVVSHYGDTQAPPNLFSRSLFDELLASDDKKCAKPVIRRHSDEAVAAQWPPEALKDLDVAADYEALRTQLER
jgi:molybdenum cofactor cytidylyltransferase